MTNELEHSPFIEYVCMNCMNRMGASSIIIYFAVLSVYDRFAKWQQQKRYCKTMQNGVMVETLTHSFTLAQLTR